MRLRLSQVVASIDDPSAGPSYSVARLASGLSQLGHQVSLETVAGWRSGTAGGAASLEPDVVVTRHAHTFSEVPLLSSLCWSEGLRRSLEAWSRQPGVIHTHGLWLMPNVYPGWIASAPDAAVRVVLSPRGMLSDAALAYSSVKKRVFWFLLQKGALSSVSCLHATGSAEYEDIRRAGLRQPVAVVPNGVDVLDRPHGKDSPSRTLLALGRIHPIKGLDRLLHAWQRIAGAHQGWSLRIAGPDEGGYSAELRGIVNDLGLPRVSIEGPLHGDAKAAAFGGASLFVLPSITENFAMTVAEALAAGLPVISTKGAPWSGLGDHRCGWWIDLGVDSLADALSVAMDISEQERAQMGERGRAWMQKDFGWPAVAGKLTDVYAWVAGMGERPATVILD